MGLRTPSEYQAEDRYRHNPTVLAKMRVSAPQAILSNALLIVSWQFVDEMWSRLVAFATV
jgi:hypothetical protein